MEDKKIIRITMLILFLTLFLVYSVYFQVKKSQKDPIPSINTIDASIETGTIVLPSITELQTGGGIGSGSIGTIYSGDILQSINTNVVDTVSNGSGTNGIPALDSSNDILLSLPGFTQTNTNTIQDNSIPGLDLLTAEIPDLTGTIAYFSDISITQSLGLTPLYILNDLTYPSIYYAYMGTGIIDYNTIALALDGDVYTIRTELDIEQNNLVGDIVQFINIPGITYTKSPVITRKIVFMGIRYRGDTWLIQIPYANYHDRKMHIKNTFTQSY